MHSDYFIFFVHRDPLSRVRALDKMLSLSPLMVIPQHTLPLANSGEAKGAMRAQRDALKMIHDQSLRWMNKGLGPSEVAERVTLPDRLASHPFLQEHLGTVEWVVRDVFEHYVGWFSGDPSDLHTLPSEAKRMVAMAGGEEAAVKKAREAFDKYELQWAAELCDKVREVNPDNQEARASKMYFFFLG